MIEMARIRPRSLVRLIDTVAKSVVCSNFADTALASQDITIAYVAVAADRARFREKAFVFLREHEDDVVLFVRSTVGMDRIAATAVLSSFAAGTTSTSNQLAFVELLVDQLTQRGTVDPSLIYEAPFTGVAPTGPDGLFTGVQVVSLVAVLRHIRSTAEAS